MNSPQHHGPLLFILLGLAVAARAGEVPALQTPSAPEPGSWAFKLASPGWLASAWGETGFHGKNANVDVSTGTILSHVTFATALSAEAQRDRLGLYADYLYLGDQAGVYTSGLVSKLDVRFTQTIADADASWRIVQTPQGYVDVLAGLRYMNIYSRLQLHPNDGNIARASTRFVDVADADVRHELDAALNGVLDGQDPVLPVPPLAWERVDSLAAAIRQAKQDPELAAALASGDSARIARAKTNVANHIAQLLRRDLSRAYSLDKDWLDPYLGLKARLNLTRALYLTAKTDVGGFGAGSQLSVEAIGAVGCQLTRHVWAEAGYKYLYANYRNNGFVYDISNGGALVTVGVNF
jgi:hypothetical protein